MALGVRATITKVFWRGRTPPSTLAIHRNDPLRCKFELRAFFLIIYVGTNGVNGSRKNSGEGSHDDDEDGKRMRTRRLFGTEPAGAIDSDAAVPLPPVLLISTMSARKSTSARRKPNSKNHVPFSDDPNHGK